MTSQKPKLLARVRNSLRQRNYAYSTEQSYTSWIKRYILFHHKKHPLKMGEKEIEEFLTYLAVRKKVAAATQNQALSALIYLYQEVLHRELTDINAMRPRRRQNIPTVLTPAEVAAILPQLTGLNQLMAKILYGSGLRISECLRLRVKDVDFGHYQLLVRDSKGHKERFTILPQSIKGALQRQLQRVKYMHQADLENGYGQVYLPYALQRKYPHAEQEWIWQWVFPSQQLSTDPRSGITRRHHRSGSTLRKAIKAAAQQAGIDKHVTPHTFRHSFATHLLQNGYDIRTVQELLGHKDVKTTMIYTHVLNRGGLAVHSPLDE
ncbi:MAG: integron integrase [Chloroflexota bacterium]|nr:integron integrase [Chloroflexota bacterium]